MPERDDLPTGEFAIIDRIRDRLPDLPAGWVGPGDDGAVLPVEVFAGDLVSDGLVSGEHVSDGGAGHGVVIVSDTVVDGVHVRLDWATPADIGWKAMAVNVSDLAAMGATPVAAVAATTLATGQREVAAGLTDGLLEAADAMACPLVGGDITSGPVLVVTVTALGRLDGPAVLRSGARPGDAVLVTGTLGGPAAAVATLGRGERGHPGVGRLHRPEPRVAAGLAARHAGATAMIDVSDGLAADIGHVCEESGVGVRIDAGAVPVGEGATLDDALSGGDDYELLICHPEPEALVQRFAREELPPLTRIGTVTAERARLLVDGDERRELTGGWSHDVS